MRCWDFGLQFLAQCSAMQSKKKSTKNQTVFVFWLIDNGGDVQDANDWPTFFYSCKHIFSNNNGIRQRWQGFSAIIIKPPELAEWTNERSSKISVIYNYVLFTWMTRKTHMQCEKSSVKVTKCLLLERACVFACLRMDFVCECVLWEQTATHVNCMIEVLHLIYVEPTQSSPADKQAIEQPTKITTKAIFMYFTWQPHKEYKWTKKRQERKKEEGKRVRWNKKKTLALKT